MLRPYQLQSIEQIRARFLSGDRKVLLHQATGLGKTTVFCEIIKQSRERGKKCLVVVRGRKLVDQASKRLARESVEHGVMMAGHWNYRPDLPVQVCSIDTLISRELHPESDLIVIDEAHQATSEGYVKFLSQYPNTFIVSVTATPYVSNGLRHIADSIVKPISMLEGIEQGYLVPFKYYAPDSPDLRDVEISSSTKDYVTEQLAQVMVGGKLTGKIIQHWRELADNLPTLCFAVNVNHSKFLVQNFLAEGIPAEHCDANTPDREREKIIERLENGQTKILCNVGIWTTGVDIPCLRAIIMARPTQSYNLYIQSAGRGTRTFPGKEYCILLDHAGNIDRHGLPTDEPEVDIDGGEVKHRSKTKTCPQCFAAYRGSECPECGHIPERGPRTVNLEESEGKLIELDLDRIFIMKTNRDLTREAKKTGKKSAWVYHRMIQKFGFEKAKPYLPQWFIDRQNNPFAYSPFKPRAKVGHGS